MPVNKKESIFFKDEVSQAFFGIVGTLFILIIIIIFNLKPMIIAVIDNENQITELTLLKSQLNEKSKKLKQAKDLFVKIENEIDKLDYSFTNKANTVENLKIIEKISSELNEGGNVVVVEDINLKELIEEREIKDISLLKPMTLSASISLIGDYNSIKNFVNLLKSNLRNIEINSISFSISQKEKESSNYMNAEISLNINYFGQK